jgi:hypothetical protein
MATEIEEIVDILRKARQEGMIVLPRAQIGCNVGCLFRRNPTMSGA